jgi:hypothetical protein
MRNKLICMGMAWMLLPAMAFSQGTPKPPPLPSDLSKPITREYAADLAKFLLAEDIRTQKLSLQQASDYTFCVYRKYGEHIEQYRQTAEFKEFGSLTKKILESGSSKSLSAQEKARLETLREKTGSATNGFQDRSEEVCSKEHGVSVPRGKIFGAYIGR